MSAHSAICIAIVSFIHSFIYLKFLPMFLIELDISSSVFSCLLIYFALFDELIRSSPQVAASANLVCCLHNCGEQILQRIVKMWTGKIGKILRLIGLRGADSCHGAARPQSPFVILNYCPLHHRKCTFYFSWSV